MAGLMQFIILFVAMVASGALGYWVARQQVLGAAADPQQLEKMAQTIEQLRERATQAEAEKVRALIASDRDRKRAEAWRPNSQAHPAE